MRGAPPVVAHERFGQGVLGDDIVIVGLEGTLAALIGTPTRRIDL